MNHFMTLNELCNSLAVPYVAARTALFASLDVKPCAENPIPVTDAYISFVFAAKDYEEACAKYVKAYYPDMNYISKANRDNMFRVLPTSSRTYTIDDLANLVNDSLKANIGSEEYYIAKARIMEAEDYLIMTGQKSVEGL